MRCKRSLAAYAVLCGINLVVFLMHLCGEYIFGSERINESLFNFSDCFLVYVLPIYAALYGVLSNIVLRSVIHPSLALLVVSAGIYPLIYYCCHPQSFPHYNLLFMIVSVTCFLISIVFSLITLGIRYAVRRMKNKSE